MSPTIWTPYRKWMGNLIPAVVWLVPTAIGLRMAMATHELIGLPLCWLTGGTFVGWLALNQFGLFQNARMRRRLLVVLGKSGDLPSRKYFMGFSTPKYTGVLDAHEDVGFLCCTESELIFVSETRTLDLKRSEIKSIRFRPNVHSMVLLGRWISIEGTRSGSPLRMLTEPRERSSMLANFLLGKKILKELNEWLTTPQPHVSATRTIASTPST